MSNNNNEKKYSLKLKKKFDFNGEVKSKLITSKELSKMINRVMHGVFSDYYGSNISPSNNGVTFNVTLVFEYRPGVDDERFKAITPKVKDSRNLSGNDRIRNFKNMRSLSAYALTKEGKDILSDFIKKDRSGKIDWNTYEQMETNVYGKSTCKFLVRNIDLELLLSRLYGEYNDEKHRVFYEAKIQRPLKEEQYTIYGPRVENYLIKITQLDSVIVKELHDTLGISPTLSNSIMPIVTDM